MHPVRDRFRATAAFLLVASLLSQAALAQEPAFGLRTQFRLVNAMPGGSNSGDVRADSGWVASGPVVLSRFNFVTNINLCSSFCNITTIADYGDLQFIASGFAHAVPPEGVFFGMDDAVGGRPRVEYRDRLHVASSKLPHGTPVDLYFDLTVVGSLVLLDTYPIVSRHAELLAGRPGDYSPLQLTLSGAGTLTGIYHSFVGDSVDVHGQLFAEFWADGVRTLAEVNASVASELRARTQVHASNPAVTVQTHFPTLDVELDSPALALMAPRPNPASGGHATIEYALRTNAPATLALFDLGGRRILQQEVGALGAGRHVLDLAREHPLAPGVYLVRLSQGGESRTVRLAVLH